MPRRRIQFVLALAAGCQYCGAAQVSTTYLGGLFGDWYDATAWSGGVVPINNATTTFAVSVPAGRITAYPTGNRPPVVIDQLNVGGGASVSAFGFPFRIQQAVNIDGKLEDFGGGTITLATNAALTGNGTILLGGGAFVAGFVRIGSPLELPSSLSVVTSTQSTLNTFGSALQPTRIRGRVTTAESSYIHLNGSSFVNAGTLVARGQNSGIVFNFNSWKLEDIGSAVRENGGAFVVGGVLENANRTFRVDETSGLWRIAGTIRGGTIDVAPDHVFSSPTYYSARLDGAVLNGKMSIGAAGDLYLVDGVLRGSGEVQLFNPVIEGYSQIRSNTSSIRIGSGMTARFTGQSVGPLPENSGIGDPSERKPIFIDGTALSETYPYSSGGMVDFAMYGDVTNTGTIQTAPRAGWVIEGDVESATGSTFNLAIDPNPPPFAPKPLTIHGDFDLRAANDRLLLSLSAPAAYLSEFTIASADQFLGEFDSVSPGFEVFVQGSNMIARVVPETSTAMSAAACLLLARCRKHRRLPGLRSNENADGDVGVPRKILCALR